jgi:hypothetical protein
MSLMSPAIMIGSSFSQNSLNQINDHLLRFGSCLEQREMAPSLTDSKLSLGAIAKRRAVMFSGQLISRSGEFIAGAPIKLTIGKKTISLTTRANGRFSYITSQRALKSSSKVFATTAGGEATSRSIKLSRLI